MGQSVDEPAGPGSSVQQLLGNRDNTGRATKPFRRTSLKGFGKNGPTLKPAIEFTKRFGAGWLEKEVDASLTSAGANVTPLESARKRSRDDPESSIEIVGGEIVEGCDSTRGPKRRVIEAEDPAFVEDHIEAEGLSGELGDDINATIDEPLPDEAQSVASLEGGTEATLTEEGLQSDTDPKSTELGNPENGEYSSTDSTDPDATDPDASDPFSMGRLRKRQCRWLSTKLENTITSLEGKTVLPSEVQLILRLSEVIREKYEQFHRRKKPPPPVNRTFPQINKTLAAIFRGPAEVRRSWMSSSCSELMAWRQADHSSKGQVRDAELGMFAGKSIHAGGLGTDRERRVEIELHSNFGNRKPTCFISFTVSFSGMVRMTGHFLMRGKKQFPARTLTIHLMNTAARKRAGRPILGMEAEIKSYDCKTTHTTDFYHDEVLVPFQVWPEELVWSWRYHDVVNWMAVNKASFNDWRLKVAVPCFEEHEKASLAGASAADLRNVVANLLRSSMLCALQYLHI